MRWNPKEPSHSHHCSQCMESTMLECHCDQPEDQEICDECYRERMSEEEWEEQRKHEGET